MSNLFSAYFSSAKATMENISMKLKDETHHNPLVGNNPAPTAFNTLDQQSTDNHFPQHQSRQFLSEKEKERPTSDTGDGHKQQQHNLHSISNNLSVNSKCDPRSPFSVSSTSPSVVEQPNHNTEENTEEVTQSQESSTIKPSISSHSKLHTRSLTYKESQLFCFRTHCIQNKTIEMPRGIPHRRL